ncbi:hypothetical protein FH972_021481 [Carpinus fangiana]|uniref:Uncharacterized protein n=1 Tax=Carpinus fangiana TaxID=176857 RepID=A0A5N6KRM7_9ROSI|nr:hypothetical protein FH972_021481 [Carpinus fangiana]
MTTVPRLADILLHPPDPPLRARPSSLLPSTQIAREAIQMVSPHDDNDLETPDDLSQEDQAEHERTSFNFDDENAIEHSETGSVLEQQHDETSYIYQRSQSWAVPPPDEQMVYYPAPVPMNLNLPKRLSRQSSATIQAQRRSQILDAMDTETRRSTRWLPNDSSLAEQDEPTTHEIKRKTLNLQKLPPQLRASMFFDHQPVPHHLEIQQGSAVLTLERMLDASAQTPIGVAATLPAPRARKSRSTLMSNEALGLRQSRSSVMPGTALSNDYLSTPKSLRFDRSSSSLAIQTDALGETKAREYDECTDEDAFVQSSKDFSGSVEDDYVHVGDTVGADENLLAQEESEDSSGEENHSHELASAQPNTLLAELALRKEQLRSRNRTAAKSFPDGMQSTLLELDEVAQIEKRRRMKKPTQLAWESMEAANSVKAQQADDDIPLAILYGNKSGLVGRAGERPIGLMEKRALDDNEPLSQRRNRLLGIREVTSHHTRQQSRGSVPIVGVAPQEQSEVEMEETLAQRTRRLRSSRLLDEAIGLESGKHVRAISDDFASEMMSQLGVDSSQGINKDAKTPQTEETLGQRKRRLQAERQITGSSANDVNDGQHAHPGLRSTQSLANILAAAPVGVNKFSNTPIPRVGSIGLLRASEVELAARRQHITDRNLRSTTTMRTGGPLVEIPFGDKRPFFRGEMSRERQLLDSYNDSFGGIASRPQSTSPGPQKSMANKNSAMNLSLHYDPGLHTPSPQMYQRQQPWQAAQGHGISSVTSMSVPMIQPGYAFAPNSQAQYWQQQMYPTMNPTLNVNTTLGPGMALAFAEADMSPEQRTNIDRWRQSVMP